VTKTVLLFTLCIYSMLIFAQEESENTELDFFLIKAYASIESFPDSALNYADSVLLTKEKNATLVQRINAHTIKGIVYKNKGFYDLATNNYISALQNAILSNDQGRVSVCLNNIGVIFKIQKNYPLAVRYFKQSIKIEETLNNPLQVSIRYYNLGETFLEQDSTLLANLYFTKSLLIEEEENNLEGIIYGNYGLALVEKKRKNLTVSKKQMQASLAMIDSSSFIEIKFNLTNALGEIFALENQLDSSNLYYEMIQNYENKNEFLTMWIASSDGLAKNHYNLKHYKVAYDYKSVHDSLHSNMLEVISKQKIEELSYLYNFSLQEKEISQLKHNKQRLIEKKEMTGDLLIFILFSVFLVLIALIIRRFNKSNA
jgi:tetratricopeptide (TPR) repeat protein